MNNKINIINVNEADFETKVLEESTKKLIVVDFWAPWCGPCKQLTPILEKVISQSPNKITLAKVNIDENQQIAAQLRIQSIPAVFAFKDKQLVNAFQGVIPEKEIINFLEKALGEKLDNNFDDFYETIQNLLSEEEFNKARTMLEDFISENSKEIKGICLYADCLISMNELDSANELLNSLDEEILNKDEIQKIFKRIDIINKKIVNGFVNFYPDFHKNFKFVKNLNSIRTIIKNKKDARICIVKNEDNFINILSGKIDHIFYAFDEVLKILKKN